MTNEIWGIPIGLFSTLVASGVALLTVTLNLWADRRKRREDREASLRKEILLMAIEGAAKSGAMITAAMNPRMEPNSDVFENNGWMNKVHAVGTFDTVKSFDELGEALAVLVTELGSIRVQLSQEENNLESIREQRQSIIDAMRGWVTEDADGTKRAGGVVIPATGVTADSGWLKAMFTLDEKANESQERCNVLVDQLRTRGFEGLQVFSEKLRRASMQVRKEIGMPALGDDYEEMASDSARRAHELMVDFGKSLSVSRVKRN